MIGYVIIIGMIAVALMGYLLPITGLISQKNPFGTDLERYITSRNPQNPGDVERLMTQYQREQERKTL